MFGIFGIMLGTVIGNVSALLILSTHYFKKSNTLKFVAYFSFRNIWYCLKYSITDGINFLLWGIVDFILISYISRSFGDKYLVVLAVAISLIEFAVIFDGIARSLPTGTNSTDSARIAFLSDSASAAALSSPVATATFTHVAGGTLYSARNARMAVIASRFAFTKS